MGRENTHDVFKEGEVTDPGLCAKCIHHAVVVNKHDSEFHLCKKNKSDPSYPKYPRLPVLKCTGFESLKSDEPSH